VASGVVLAVAILAAVLSILAAQSVYTRQEQHLRGLAAHSAQALAREVSLLMSEMRRSVAQFVTERADLLEQLRRDPDHLPTQQALNKALEATFPDHSAHTLVLPDGQLLIDDLGETVGDLCRDDIAQAIRQHRIEAVIHPGPQVYHFDVAVPWPTPGGNGLFFLSFRAHRIAQLLNEVQLPEHTLLLVNRDQPALMEITRQGSREVLAGEHMLEPAALASIDRLGAQAQVPGTRWLATSLPAPELHAALRQERMLRMAGAVLVIALACGTILWALWHDALRQRSLSDAQRLAATVFDSVQEGIAITDLRGRYLAVNAAFSRITEYSEEEVVGQLPSLLGSGRHTPDFYQAMWRSLNETGEWQGEIWNRRKGGEVYLEWLSISTVRDAEGQAHRRVAVYTDLSRIRHARTELEHLAHCDALTDLPNRLLLHSRLKHALDRAHRNRTEVAVLYMDLDGFKEVNDTLGHAAGDQVLQQVARRLSARLREADTISRLGGDEFVVLLEDQHVTEPALQVARTIIDQVGQPMTLDNGHRVQVGASIGISRFPDHGHEMATLLAKADAAMYAAKQARSGFSQAPI
jgi:diguanylate cyclase (GGDEF)-like protein/PAS domain S-box-containing protein